MTSEVFNSDVFVVMGNHRSRVDLGEFLSANPDLDAAAIREAMEYGDVWVHRSGWIERAWKRQNTPAWCRHWSAP